MSLPLRLGLFCTVLSVAACGKAPSCRVDPAFVEARVGNASCLIQDNGRVLAIKHRFSGRYNLPGGRSEESESAQCTAHRETWEETGIDVIVGRRLTGARRDGGLYECALPPGIDNAALHIPLRGHIEVEGLEWVDPTEHRPRQWRYRGELRQIQQFVASH